MSTLSRRAFLGAAALAAQAATRPNIVFILIDDLRFNALHCTGHPFAETPHIDRLAQAGAIFNKAYVAIPLCSPSRASFLTGRYAHAHGVTHNGDSARLSHSLVTFPKLLQEAGYATAYIGKIHMGTDPSPRPGIDRWVSFRGQGIYNDPPLNVDGREVRATGYMTDILSGHAAEFIRRNHGGKPFCLTLAHKAVHGPFTPAERHKALYSNQPVTRGPNHEDTLQDKPAMIREVNGQPAVTPRGGTGDEVIRNQLRCLKSIDDGVGDILKALDETGQTANTLIVFTSDNGYFWGDHGLGDKRWAFEESIRIPMIAAWPGRIKPASTISQPVLSLDLAPTFLAAAGLTPPAAMHGRTLLPLFAGKTGGWRKTILTEYFAEKNFPKTPSWQAVQDARWKYVHYTDIENSDELYDLTADPHELRNRARDPKAARELARLKQELARQLDITRT